MERNLIIILMLLLVGTHQAKAQSDDFGMWYELGAEKKLSNKFSVGAEAEFRTRNNMRTADRFSVGIGAEYKILKQLKASAGYTFLYDNNMEELDLKRDGLTPNKWMPSYWGTRHRFNVSLTGSIDIKRLNLSLRERWQYTYRPEASGKRYDIDNDEWDIKKGKGKNELRSRFQVSYDFPHWKFDPFANIEMFTAKGGTQKMRYQVGVDYKIKKIHNFALTYRFQDVRKDDDDNEANRHLIGISYTYKFK
jgi:predicted porin